MLHSYGDEAISWLLPVEVPSQFSKVVTHIGRSLIENLFVRRFNVGRMNELRVISHVARIGTNSLPGPRDSADSGSVPFGDHPLLRSITNQEQSGDRMGTRR